MGAESPPWGQRVLRGDQPGAQKRRHMRLWDGSPLFYTNKTTFARFPAERESAWPPSQPRRGMGGFGFPSFLKFGNFRVKSWSGGSQGTRT